MTFGLLTRYGMTRKITGGGDPEIPDIITTNLRAYYHFRDLRNGWLNGHQPSTPFLPNNNSGGTTTLSSAQDWDGNGFSARHTRGGSADSNIGYREISPALPAAPARYKTRIYLPSGHTWTSVSMASEVGSASHTVIQAVDVGIVDQWQELEVANISTNSTTAFIVLRGEKSGGTPVLYADGFQICAGEDVFFGGFPGFQALTTFASTIPDLGPNNNHATPINAPLPSIYGMVTSLNASGGSTGASTGGGNLSGSFTITGVARLSPARSNAKSNSLIGASTNGGLQLRFNTNGTWQILRQSVAVVASGNVGTDYYEDKWWTFTIRYNGSTLTLRIGGVQVLSMAYGTGFTSAVPWWGVRAGSAAENFEGCIVNGAIWTAALTDQEVADMELHMKDDAESLGLTVEG